MLIGNIITGVLLFVATCIICYALFFKSGKSKRGKLLWIVLLLLITATIIAAYFVSQGQ